MGDVSKAEARKLLQDKVFRDSVIDAIASSADTESDIVEDIVDELSDIIENDPTFKRELTRKLLSSPEAKEKIANALVEELQ